MASATLNRSSVTDTVSWGEYRFHPQRDPYHREGASDERDSNSVINIDYPYTGGGFNERSGDDTKNRRYRRLASMARLDRRGSTPRLFHRIGFQQSSVGLGPRGR